MFDKENAKRTQVHDAQVNFVLNYFINRVVTIICRLIIMSVQHG